MRTITIEPTLNGWIVRVGCQIVVFTNLGKMLHEIYKYIRNPKQVEEAYLAKAENTQLPPRDVPAVNPTPTIYTNTYHP